MKKKTKQIEQISFETIATIASMIEAKDSYTKGHSVRVAEYSAMLAKELGWSDESVQNLKYIALLHDIGKVGIPDSVLNKPGKLTEIEYNIIKSHATIGGDILKDIETIPNVDMGARYHHERYDGKGYPSGLKGEEIPDLARIICIADAYDAMNSKRVYRDSLNREKICEQIREGRGKQFDPAYADAFLKLLDEGRLVINDEKQNQEKTNDVLGHLAGDYALKAVGEVLLEYSDNAIISRIGGDEFLYFMVGANEDKAVETVEKIICTFEKRKENNTYLSFSSLSVGISGICSTDTYADVLQKADKALYHVKQSGKAGYYVHTHFEGAQNQKTSVDLDKLVKSLRKSGAYNGSLSLEYREFAKIYDFVQNLVNRYNHNMQLIMLTLEPVDYNNIDIDEQEYAMKCMEETIIASLRNVDVSTRFSSEQFLVVLFNADTEDVSLITNRIFDNFYKVYHKTAVNVSYDIADLLKSE